MKIPTVFTYLLIGALAAGCSKKTPDSAQALNSKPSEAANVVATPAAPVAEPTQAQRDMAEKQSLLDYAMMEDKYSNDPHGQWANSAKASSTFGDTDGKTPDEVNLAVNMKGPIDGKSWTNNKQELGIDTIELGYEKPVTASEVRVVMDGGVVEAISKIELQDTNGGWNTVWSGVSEVKRDKRGRRTWFVRNFEKTPYKAKGVKVTFVNNLDHGYKVVDAVQLVGE